MPSRKSYGDSNRWKGQSLWRLPPPPELQYIKDGELPDPSPFYLKPVFLWSPEKIIAHLFPHSKLPCIKALDESIKCSGHATFAPPWLAGSIPPSVSFAVNQDELRYQQVVPLVVFKCLPRSG